MDLADKILIVGGLFNLVYGTVTGALLGKERLRAEHASRYLVFAHVGPFMQGAMLLGLVFAVSLSQLTGGVETVAASLLVASSALLAVKDTLNWSKGVKDEFKEKPALTRALGASSVLLYVPGLAILVVGTFAGL